MQQAERCDTSQISGEDKFSIEQSITKAPAQVDGGQTLPRFFDLLCDFPVSALEVTPSSQSGYWVSWAGQDLWPLCACPHSYLLTVVTPDSSPQPPAWSALCPLQPIPPQPFLPQV